MAIKKYLDWKGWLEGLYLSWIKTVTSTLMTLGATNAVDQLGVKGFGLSLQQAGGLLLSLTLWEIIKYLNAKPKPETVTETTETQIIEKK